MQGSPGSTVIRCDCLAVERVDRVERELAAMHGTVRIPGLFEPIGLLAEHEAVLRHPFKTPVEYLLGEHRGCQSAQVLDELAVLERTDFTRADRFARDLERREVRGDFFQSVRSSNQAVPVPLPYPTKNTAIRVSPSPGGVK